MNTLSENTKFIMKKKSEKKNAVFKILSLSHLLIARCDIGVQLSVRPFVHNLCQVAYSVAVIAGSMKPCIVITLDTHFKKAP